MKTDGAEPVVWEVSPGSAVIYVSSVSARTSAQSWEDIYHGKVSRTKFCVPSSFLRVFWSLGGKPHVGGVAQGVHYLIHQNFKEAQALISALWQVGAGMLAGSQAP